MPKAIFLDLDDTIISFEGVTETAWKTVCGDFVKKTGYCREEDLRNAINSVRKWYWSDAERHKAGRMDMVNARRAIVKSALEQLNHPCLEHALEIADNYSKLQYELIHLFPDSIQTLKQLKNLGLKLVLITNGLAQTQRAKIQRFDLEKYFEVILIEGEVGFGKPDIRIYQKALEILGINPDEAWMVGDNLVWDIQAPQKLGIYTVWNDYNKSGLPKDTEIKPDIVIQSIADLIPYLDKNTFE